MASDSEEERNRNTYKSDGQATTWMEMLPREIYLDILSRQPILSLLECKLVSQLWLTSVKNPVLTSMHLSRAAENNLCLIFFSDWPKSKLQLVHIGGEEGYSETIKVLKTPFESVLPEFEVVGSCNGLVCLYNYFVDDPLYIYNPFTIEYRELPKLGTNSQSNICRVVFGFGFHQRTRDYKVINIVYYKLGNNIFAGGDPEAFVLTLGNPIWRNMGKIPYMLNGPTSEAMVNGRLHWLTLCVAVDGVRYRDIVSFDLDTEEFQVVPRPTCGGLNKDNYHLVTLRGCLSAVVSCGDGSNEIWVMKDYNVQAFWTKEFIIGNYVPQGFNMNGAAPARRRKNGYSGRNFRVLYTLENGEILFLYRCRSLVSYNPHLGEFKDLNFQGLPLEFQTTVHVGSLVSVNSVVGMQRGE